MPKYASNTSVAPGEIESTLDKYGATSFSTMKDELGAHVYFRITGLAIHMSAPLPNPNDEEFTQTPTGRDRNSKSANEAWERAVRQRWCAMFIALKAKLEAVELNISTIEKEFLPFIIMPDGRTFGDHVIPEIKRLAASGAMPRVLALPAPGEKS